MTNNARVLDSRASLGTAVLSGSGTSWVAPNVTAAPGSPPHADVRQL
jgi:hypothetical protein